MTKILYNMCLPTMNQKQMLHFFFLSNPIHLQNNPSMTESNSNGYLTPYFNASLGEDPIHQPNADMQSYFIVICCVYFGLPICTYLVTLTSGIIRDKKINQLPLPALPATEEAADLPLSARSSVESVVSQQPPQVLLTFRNVHYSVELKNKKTLNLLKGIDGFAAPKTMTAIMGPSGCGKSTLLEVLCQRKTSGTISSSSMAINGEEMSCNHQLLKRASGFVQQSDCLLPRLTVRETLTYAADFQLDPKNFPVETKKLRVEQVINDLGLSNVADARIGDGGSAGGLSGGQKRRVTVGIEMMSNPSLLFLDEPTSGLDAYGSLQVIQMLRKLADEGRTILLTIHQPRCDIFSLFDNLLLLKSGETMYFGPIKDAILPYFRDAGYFIPPNANPAEFVVDLTHDDVLDDDDEMATERKARSSLNSGATRVKKPGQKLLLSSMSMYSLSNTEEGIGQHLKVPLMESMESCREDFENNVDDLVALYAASDLQAKNKLFIQIVEDFYNENSSMEHDFTFELPLKLSKFYVDESLAGFKYGTSLWYQVFILTHRAYKNDSRNAAYLFSYGLGAIMSLFYGTLYVQVDSPEKSYADSSVSLSDQIRNWNSRTGVIFQVLAAAVFLEQGTVASVAIEKQIFMREHSSGVYGSCAFNLAWTLRIFTTSTIKGLMYTPLFYFLSGFRANDQEAYILFSIIMCCQSMIGSAIALMCAMGALTLRLAIRLFAFASAMSGSLSGYFISPGFIGPWFIWLYYLNFFKYSLEGAITNQYHNFFIYDSVTNTSVPVINSVVLVNGYFNKYTNILVLMIYPMLMNFFAFVATYVGTHGSKVKLVALEDNTK